MNTILVDTSVWINALNGQHNWQTAMLANLIDQNSRVAVCSTIVQEVLQGIRDDRSFNLVKDSLSGFELLSIAPLEAAYGAANLYRTIRRKGITIRKSNDCLIAFHAIHFDAYLLHDDNDFDQIAAHSTLKVLGS